MSGASVVYTGSDACAVCGSLTFLNKAGGSNTFVREAIVPLFCCKLFLHLPAISRVLSSAKLSVERLKTSFFDQFGSMLWA